MIWLNALVQGIMLGGLYALFACGLSLLFGVMEVINLAHGDMAVAAGYLAVVLIPATHIGALWSFVIVVPIFAVGGYLLQRTLLQRSLDVDPLITLLVTFGLSIVLENVLLEVFSADSHSFAVGSLVTGAFKLNAQISIGYLPLLILAVAVVVLIGLQLLLSYSKTGRLIRAVADDREASQITGIDYRHIFGLAASIALGTVALAGLALGMYSQFNPTTGPSYLIYAFEAVVVGGLGSLWGTLLGGVVLGIATTVGFQLSPNFGALGPHLVFLAVLAFLPRGLLPKKALA